MGGGTAAIVVESLPLLLLKFYAVNCSCALQSPRKRVVARPPGHARPSAGDEGVLALERERDPAGPQRGEVSIVLARGPAI